VAVVSHPPHHDTTHMAVNIAQSAVAWCSRSETHGGSA
jgi:hypothetical protein